MPALSQAAALVMLAGLGLLLLHRMRLPAGAGLFLAGLAAWFLGGLASLAANPGIPLRPTLALLSLLTLYGLFAATALVALRGPAALEALRRVLAGFVLLGAGLSFWQIASGTGFVEQGRAAIQRAYGSDVHPVSFAIQITAALVALEILRLRLNRRAGLVHWLLMVAGAAALYLTYARTAWLMALITLAALLLRHGPPARRLLLGLGGALGGAVLVLGSQRFADLASLPQFLANFSVSDVVFDWRYVDNSASWRIVNWSYGLHQALARPLLGFGPGQSANASFFSLEMHNIFLETFFEGGVFGFLAFLLLLAGLARMHRRLPGATPRDRQSRLLANAFGIALLLAVTFSTSFVDQLMSFLLYMLLLSAAATPLSPPAPRHRLPATARRV